MSHMKAVTLKARPKKDPVGRGSVNGKNGNRSPHELVKAVRDGVPFRKVEALRRNLGLSLDQVAEKLGIARATMHRRKVFGRLAPDESDRVLRFDRLQKQAADVFGDNDRGRQWLSFPQYGLGGAIPLDYARSEVGAREVEKLLGRIECGVLS